MADPTNGPPAGDCCHFDVEEPMVFLWRKKRAQRRRTLHSRAAAVGLLGAYSLHSSSVDVYGQTHDPGRSTPPSGRGTGTANAVFEEESTVREPGEFNGALEYAAAPSTAAHCTLEAVGAVKYNGFQRQQAKQDPFTRSQSVSRGGWMKSYRKSSAPFTCPTCNGRFTAERDSSR